MPNRDTTGPMGTGMRTGRQMGGCAKDSSEVTTSSNFGMGRRMGRSGCRRMNRSFCRRVEYNDMNNQEFLKQEKLILEQRLTFINSQLNQEQ